MVLSLDNNKESGETVEDMLDDKEDTGAIRQDETKKENTRGKPW